MPAIITQDFRKFNTENFINKLLGTTPENLYYLGIGKPNPWVAPQSVPMPMSGKAELDNVKKNLIAVQAIRTGAETDVNFGRMIPNITYVQGEQYKRYNTHDDSCWYPTVVNGVITVWPCYFVKDNAIWLVLRNNANDKFSTTNDPSTGVGTTHPTIESFPTSTSGVYADTNNGVIGSYIYGKLCTLSTTGRFLDTKEFIQVDDIEVLTDIPHWSKGLYSARINDVYLDKIGGDSAGITDRFAFAAYNALPAGTTPEFAIDTSNSTTTVAYNTAAASINFSTGSLQNVVATTPYVTTAHPFEFVDIEYSVLPDYTALSVASIVELLPSWYIGFTAQISSSSKEIPDDITYRQLSILSINEVDQAAVLDIGRGSTGINDDKYASDCLKIATLSNSIDGISALTHGDILYGNANSRAIFVGYTFNVQTSTAKITYIQNKETGHAPLTGNLKKGSFKNPISLLNGLIPVNVLSTALPEFIADDKIKVLFVENTPPLSRNNVQIEDIKLVIQF
jgi:hypothetical protein